MATTVDELLKKPFSERSHEEKLKIVSGNRPLPPLRMFSNYKNDHGDNEKGYRNTVMYDKIKWSSGCKKRQKMFCWPCLLFMPTGKWVSGISKLQYVLENYEKHQNELEHLEAVFKLQFFKMENAIDCNAEKKEESNETTPTSDCNPYVLKCLIDAICYLITHATLSNEKYKCNTIEVSDCISYLNGLEPSVYEAINLLQKSPKVLNDLVDAVTVVLKAAITEETRKSTYVSIILSEHVMHKEKSQISTVLRYVKDGKAYERFVGFTNSLEFRLQHDCIAQHLLNVIKECDIRENFFALSIDGAVLSASELIQLFQLDEFQDKYFVPCYYNGFGRVLMQSVSHFEDCGMFLKTLASIESYFEDEDNFLKLENILFNKIPHLKNNKWYSTSPFVVFLSMYRKYVVFYFNKELQFSKCSSPVDVVKITVFLDFLGDLKSIFLLKTFGKLFLNHFDKNLNFATDIFGINFDRERYINLRWNVERFQTNGFPDLWIEANMEMIGEEAPQSLKIQALNNPDKAVYVNYFVEMLRQIMKEIECRRKDIPRLTFCDLLNRNSSGVFAFKSHLITLLLHHEKGFDRDTLESEITVLKGNKTLFTNKSVHDLMETFHFYDMSGVYTQLFRLAEFILAIPFLPPSKDVSYKTTKLKQIDTYSYIPQETGIPSGETSILCVEKLMLKDLKCSESFHDDVIEKFYEIQKDSEFEEILLS